MERADAASLAAVASVLRGNKRLSTDNRSQLADTIERIIRVDHPDFASEMIERAAFLRRAAERLSA